MRAACRNRPIQGKGMLTDEKGVGSPAGLYAASGCDAASPRGEPQAAISREESSVLPDAPPQAKPLPGKAVKSAKPAKAVKKAAS